MEHPENTINFHDFLLYLLTKIILISKWGNNSKYSIHHQNPFFFDLFSSILEFLSEIIQGCKSDLLSNLFVNFEDEQNNLTEKGE